MEAPSVEELTWLQASIILVEDTPPAPPPKDNGIFMTDISFHDKRYFRSTSAATATGCYSPRKFSAMSSDIGHSVMTKKISASAPSSPPRSEWIYRTLKNPTSTRAPASSPYAKPHFRPMSKHHRSASASVSRSQSSARSRTTLSEDGHPSHVSSTAPFWTNVLHPRSRSVRSAPSLKTIPSQSQIVFTPPDFPENVISTTTHFSTPPKRSSSLLRSSSLSSKPMAFSRPPSVSSTLDSASISNSASSSRSASPVPMTPVSRSPSFSGTAPPPPSRHRYHYVHRRNQTQGEAYSSLHPFSSSCPPSKSILTRTSSSSTKDSCHTTSKSVKFAPAPMVHATEGYWDIKSIANDTMGINVDAMDVDDDPFANLGSRGKQLEESGRGRSVDLHSRPSTSSQDDEYPRNRAGFKKLMNWRPATPTIPTTTTITPATTLPTPPASPSPSHTAFSINSKAPSTPSRRPSISNPYALGAYPSSNFAASQSTTSLPAPSRYYSPLPSPMPTPPPSLRVSKATGIISGGDTHHLHPNYHKPPSTPTSARSTQISHPRHLPASSLIIPIRPTPSCESFRSSKSAAARSMRSVGSAKSILSTRGLKAWFNRRIGWADPVN